MALDRVPLPNVLFECTLPGPHNPWPQDKPAGLRKDDGPLKKAINGKEAETVPPGPSPLKWDEFRLP